METFKNIFSRRSIRKYRSKKVPKIFIQKILAAAMQAPSAKNDQPWQFIIIDDRKILEKASKINFYLRMLKKAPVAILVCGDTRLEKIKDFWILSCAAAIQNMLLAINDLGLGGVWTGVYPNKKRMAGYRKLLALPKNVVPLGCVAIGYPAESPPAEDRFQQNRIYYNRFYSN